jgi:hypothetical protein
LNFGRGKEAVLLFSSKKSVSNPTNLVSAICCVITPKQITLTKQTKHKFICLIFEKFLFQGQKTINF